MTGTRDCRSIENELALFVGGELAARDRARLEEHLAACAACAGLVERLRRARAALRSGLAASNERVPDLWPAVRARLDLQPVSAAPVQLAQPAGRSSVRRLPRWIPISAAAAAVFAFGLWMGQRSSAPVPPSDRGELVDGSVSARPAPIHVQPAGLRRLAPEETPLSSTPGARGVGDFVEGELGLPSAGAEAASLHSRPLGFH